MTTPPYPYMPRTANARIAGFAFLFYIAVVVASMILFGGATTDASDRPRVHARRGDLDVTFLVSDESAAPFVGP